MIVFLAATVARAADEGFDAHRFRPNLDGQGIATVTGAEVLDEWTAAGSLWYDHTGPSAEVRAPGQPGRAGHLVDGMDVFTLAAAVGLPANFSLGASIPFFAHIDARRFGSEENHLGGGFGDVLGELKWKAFTDSQGRFAMGLAARGTAPTGDDERYRGEERWTAEGRVLLEGRPNERLRILGHIGYEWLDGSIEFGRLEIDDRIRLGAGVGFMLFRAPSFRKESREERREGGAPPSPDAWRLDIEAAVDAAFVAEDPGDRDTRPVEVYGGLRLDTPVQVSLVTGGSAGVTEAVGAAEWRFFIGVAFAVGEPRRNAWRFGRW